MQVGKPVPALASYAAGLLAHRHIPQFNRLVLKKKRCQEPFLVFPVAFFLGGPVVNKAGRQLIKVPDTFFHGEPRRQQGGADQEDLMNPIHLCGKGPMMWVIGLS